MLTWIVLRAAGIGAYLMLWATVSWGLAGTTALFGKKVSRATAIAVHQFLATAAFILLGVHLGGVLLDSFVRLTPLDVLVPMHSTFKAVPVALGILGMYSLAVVTISSWARKHLGTKVWRALHLLAVPAFALALVHGVFTGTDTVRPWMWWGYVLTGTSVLFLMLTRALTIGLRPERHAVPAGVRARTPERAVAPREAPIAPKDAPGVAAAAAPAAVPVPATAAVPVPRAPDAPSTIVIRLEVVMKDDRGHDRGTQHIDVPVRMERFSPPAPARNGSRASHREPRPTDDA